MANVTTFGKELRKLRVDTSEVLGAMAKRLNISAAYLSAIEVGTRAIPDDFVAKVVKEYGLDEAMAKKLEELKVSTQGRVEMSLGDRKDDKSYVETAVMLSRDFSKLSDTQIMEINKMLKEI